MVSLNTRDAYDCSSSYYLFLELSSHFKSNEHSAVHHDTSCFLSYHLSQVTTKVSEEQKLLQQHLSVGSTTGLAIILPKLHLACLVDRFAYPLF